MATKAKKTVVGVFTDRDEAREAVQALKNAGFREDQIGIASANRRGDVDDGDADVDSYTGEGAMAGAAAGAGLGALWGLGILAGIIPAIGPAIVGGTLGILLSSAAAGAAAAGLAGALIGMGLPEEEAEYYEGELKAGRTIVTVNAGARYDEALQLLRQYGAYDISQKADIQGQEARTSGPQFGDRTIQAHEEEVNVHKTPAQKGEVKVRKEVHTEHKTVDVPVTREEVVVERGPATGRGAGTGDLQPGQELRIPVHEDEVNVEKQKVATEEVKVGKRRVQDTERVNEALRKEEIKIEKEGDPKIHKRRS